MKYYSRELSACFYVPLGFIHTTRGLLNGAGDVGFAFLNGLAEVVGRIGFAAILVNIPEWECGRYGQRPVLHGY